MLGITRREADGWWPAGAWTPEDYAAKLKVILDAGDAAGRDMSHFTPAITQMALIGEPDEIDEMLRAPMVPSSGMTTRWVRTGAGSWTSIR